jgi:zinc ribbon protein
MATESVHCPHCDADNPTGELFCQRCGRRLPRPTRSAFSAWEEALSRDRQRRARNDLLLGAGFGTVMALLTLLLSDAAPAGSVIGNAAREQWWLFGILWGVVLWVLRRYAGLF